MKHVSVDAAVEALDDEHVRVDFLPSFIDRPTAYDAIRDYRDALANRA